MTKLKVASAAVAMTILATASLAQQRTAPAPGTARLQQVASFEHQVTGVTVSPDGRIFVNFPRWTEDAPISVAEVMRDGRIRPTRMANGTPGAMPRRTRYPPRITSFASRAWWPMRAAICGSSIQLRQQPQPLCRAGPSSSGST